MINTHDLNDTYINLFVLSIRTLEGFVERPYDDRTSNHIPTIGDGINLSIRSNLALVLDELGVFSASDSTASTNETVEQKNTRYDNIINTFQDIVTHHQLNVASNSVADKGQSISEISLFNALNTQLLTFFPDNPNKQRVGWGEFTNPNNNR